jgi:hypothetical protein
LEIAGFIVTLSTFGTIFNSNAFWCIHAVFTGYVCLTYAFLLPAWLYRLFVPPNPELLKLRSQYFEDAYDHANFWSTIRMADQAEHEFNAGARRTGEHELLPSNP